MPDPRVDFVRELERADEAASAVLAELDELAAQTEDVRTRALALESFLVRLPAERTARDRAVDAAARVAADARAALARAEAELAGAENAGDAERLAAARRFHVRARDRASVAERLAAEAERARAALEREADEAASESVRLDVEAAALATALRGRPRLGDDAGAEPSPGPAGVSEWAGRARAALFVARGSLAAEREAVIRQANELGSLVLGEPLMSASAAVVARRVERALTAGPGTTAEPRRNT